MFATEGAAMPRSCDWLSQSQEHRMARVQVSGQPGQPSPWQHACNTCIYSPLSHTHPPTPTPTHTHTHPTHTHMLHICIVEYIEVGSIGKYSISVLILFQYNYTPTVMSKVNGWHAIIISWTSMYNYSTVSNWKMITFKRGIKLIYSLNLEFHSVSHVPNVLSSFDRTSWMPALFWVGS